MDDTATVTIRDLDGLRYPFDKRTGYQMHIWSDTDQGGVEVNAYWKPNFRGTPFGNYFLYHSPTATDFSWKRKLDNFRYF